MVPELPAIIVVQLRPIKPLYRSRISAPRSCLLQNIQTWVITTRSRIMNGDEQYQDVDDALHGTVSGNYYGCVFYLDEGGS
jgi:hypothetical protein